MDQRSFQPALGLSNPNLQTIVSSVGRKIIKPAWQQDFTRRSQRRDIRVQGQHLTAQYDYAHNEDAVLVMIIHGWLGSADSSYVLSTAHTLQTAGFHVARLTLRDHGGTADLNEGLFHSAMTEEVVAAAEFIMNDFDCNTAGLVGFSMGGNFALRLAAQLPQLHALAICPAISPQHTVEQIGSSIIYERYFLAKWRGLWQQKQAAFPHLYDFSSMNRLGSIQTLTEFFIKEHTDFENLQAYYAAYDLRGDTLQGVNATVLAAFDDPIIPVEHYRSLPTSIDVNLTQRGGHTAYIKNWRLESWVDDYCRAFFSERLKS